MRDEVVRQRINDCDADGGVGDMLHDYHEAHFGEGPQEEELDASAKAYFEMLEAAQKPLQLEGIGRLMALKSQFSLSRDAFDSLFDRVWKHASRKSHYAKVNVSGTENSRCT